MVQDVERSRAALGVVFACTVGNMVCMTAAVSAVFGVFLVPIAEDFGWPRAQVSGVLGLIAFLNFLAYPFVGRAIDRFGARRILLGGNMLFAASVALVVLAQDSVISFYGHFALVGLAGAIPCTAMFAKVVSEWFDRRRGLMLGVAAGVGNGIGATVMPIVAALLLATVGWKASYAVIGLIVFVVGFPSMFLWLHERKGASASMGQVTPMVGASLSEALRRPEFWLIVAALATGAGGLTAIFSHVIPVLTDRGADLALATTVMSTLALSTAVSQVLCGVLLDRFPTPRVVAPAFLLAAGGLWLIANADGPALFLAGALLGVGLGTAFGALPLFISRYFGLRCFGTISGVIYSTVMLAQGITPVLMDWSFDVEQSYATAIVVLEICLLAVAGMVSALPPFREVVRGDHGALAHVGL